MHRGSRPFLRIWHRPKLERLEPRLPPGDAILGLILAWPEGPLESLELNDDLYAEFNSSMDSRAARFIPAVHADYAAGINPAARHTESSDKDESTHQTAAELFVAAHTARINPAARYSSSLRASAVASEVRAAGLIPAVYPAGINPAARNIVGAIANQVPGLATSADSPSDADHSEVNNDYGNLPLTFEANHGQTDASVDFITRAGGGTVFLTPTAAVFSIQNSESRIQNSELGNSASVDLSQQWASVEPSGRRDLHPHVGLTPRRSPESVSVAIHMQIVGGNPNATPLGQERQPGIVNYFIGNDPSQWHANIPTFGRVQYNDVYPGIDLAYYGGNCSTDPSPLTPGPCLEYDFIVSPHADPNAITLNFAGADSMQINPQGDLVLHTAAGDMVQYAPFTYQETGQTRQEVTSRYVVDGTRVSFEVGAYDATRPLVIDPLVMGYSTYLGGSGNETVHGIAVDSYGNAYVNGYTLSTTDFPVTPGAFDTSFNGSSSNAFVTKLSGTGSSLAYSTYLGGTNGEGGGLSDIAVDASGNAYVTGVTFSNDFPTTSGAFDTTFNGNSDAFVIGLNEAGSTLMYSTYLGGVFLDGGYGIALDPIGNVLITGLTNSPNFPTTQGAFDTTNSSSIDVFVTKLHPLVPSLSYSTFVGGTGNDFGSAIVADVNGNAHVTGMTFSNDFSTTSGAFDNTYNGGNGDSFVIKLNTAGAALEYSTYLGGPHGEAGADIIVDASGNVYVTGGVRGRDFPTTAGAFDTTYNGGDSDAFVTKLSASGSDLVFSTYLGGALVDCGASVGVDANGNVWVMGCTESNIPTTPDAFDTTHNGGRDAYFIKLNPSGSALAYSTYLGGSGMDSGSKFALVANGNIYATGTTSSSDFPTNEGAFDTTGNGNDDVFLAKFCERACHIPLAKEALP